MLKNKNIVLIGGLGYLGRSFAEAILLNNGGLIIADIDKEKAESVIRDLNEKFLDKSIAYHDIDITNTESVRDFIAYLKDNYSKVDALVNNAYPRNNKYGRILEEVNIEDFNENVNLHLGGYFLSMKEFSVLYKAQGYGNIINISSIYGLIPPKFEIYEGSGFTMPVEYAAIKSAIIHITRYFAKYYKGYNIRVNCISPGGIFNNHDEVFTKAYKKHTLNKGMLLPEDLTGTLIFLLSDKSNMINGQNIVVDDGFSL